MFSLRLFSNPSGIFLLVSILVLNGCVSLPDNSERSTSYVYTDTSDSKLAQGYQEASIPYPNQSAYLLLDDGLDAFVGRALLAESAKYSIDVQYYMLHGDEVGMLFVDQLRRAADRGVRIRLLLDDIDEGHRDFGAAIFDSHPNIEVRLFNPFGRNVPRILQYVTGFGKQTRRAHNKSFTVDNTATIVGGRNIGNEYFSADPTLEFQDLDVVVFGPLAQDVSASFDQYWNSPLSYPVTELIDIQPTPQEILQRGKEFDEYIKQHQNSPYIQRLHDSELANSYRANTINYHWGTGSVYADRPEKLTQDTDDSEHYMINDLAPYMAKAEKELIILSPYFVPGNGGVEFLTGLAKKGVRVRILTNSLSSTDVSVVHAGYVRYREALLRGGVELYELNKKTTKKERKEKKKGRIGSSKSSLHAKAFVVDRNDVFIGSLNFDARSIIQNTEIGVVFQSPEIASEISSNFDQHIDRVAFQLSLEKNSDGSESIRWHGVVDGEPTTYSTEPFTSFWRRLGVGFMRFMPIESQI